MNISESIYHFVVGFLTKDQYAHLFGNLSTFCFFLVYVPQFFMYCKRRSVDGFSVSSVVLKLFGSSFLFVNSVFKHASHPIILYGFSNTIEHMLFLVQYFLFAHDWRPLVFISLPIVPYMICKLMPELLFFTDYVKPVTQMFSSIPQIYDCFKVGTTKYVSMLSQHLHFIGSIFGFLMLIIEQDLSFHSWFLYANSFIQAFSIYIAAAWFGELRFSETIVNTDETEQSDSFDSEQEKLLNSYDIFGLSKYYEES